jgi:LysR family transcriptional regulator, nitrogen assimilation regulatory protein
VELRQIRHFVGVSEAGSLLKASARLHIAQPALGQQIAALEHSVGARLFDRSSRGVTLTEAGKAFLDHAKVLLADAERARAAVRQSALVPSGEVAIGLPTTVSLIAAVPILQACREQLPQVRIKVVEAYSGFLREWLVSGRLDLALLFGDQADPVLTKQALLDDRLAFVSSSQGATAPRKMALSALSRWPLVLPGREHGLRRIIDEACEPLGITLDVVTEIESLPIVKRAVEAGLGCTILPLGAVADEVAAGRLRASTIESAAMSRRVVSATSLTRPATGGGVAVVRVIGQVLRRMVEDGSWPARWVGK